MAGFIGCGEIWVYLSPKLAGQKLQPNQARKYRYHVKGVLPLHRDLSCLLKNNPQLPDKDLYILISKTCVYDLWRQMSCRQDELALSEATPSKCFKEQGKANGKSFPWCNSWTIPPLSQIEPGFLSYRWCLYWKNRYRQFFHRNIGLELTSEP